MKVTGKLTKTEWLILALTAAGADYTISTQRRAAEAVTPDPPEPKGPVDVNTAGLEELQTLSGIGPALAQRIIDYREANGPFGSVEDLVKVRGIGEATLEKFRDSAAAGVPEAGDTNLEEDAAA